jgi:hypothetical protein
MKTITSRSLAAVGLAVLLMTVSAASQAPSSPILNALEVRRLVASSEPSDQARLSAHFTALAARYTAEAKRHTSMASSYGGNPSRNLGAGMSVHCKRLADLNTQSASAVRELAAYHQSLAAGAVAVPPAAGARFEGGAGAPAPTDQDLEALAAKAATPAEYFSTLAKRYTSDAADHKALAIAYRGLPRSPGGAAGAAVHCDRLVKLSQDAAKEATEASAMHKQLAGVSR